MSRRIDSIKNAATLTPADGTTIGDCRAVFVGVGGDVAVTLGGNVVTFKNVASGDLLPIVPSTVQSTNTTATDLIRLW